MDQINLLEAVPHDKFNLLSKEELIVFLKGQQVITIHQEKELVRLYKLLDLSTQQTLLLEDQYLLIRNKLFGKSSEKSPRTSEEKEKKDPEKKKKTRVLLPSERYPNAPIVEKHVELPNPPQCQCCGAAMKDSGMTEDSECLTAIPKKFIIERLKRHKYSCSKCHGDIQTAPVLPRITPGGSYSDEMTIDASLAKYCDLIPMDRYAAMAAREGMENLPPQSLIEGSHHLANFVEPAYEKIGQEIMSEEVVHADETPHRMLEGDEKSNWFLWGFSTLETAYFEIHNTRSGDVALELLKHSKCRYLISDVYSGYGKAVRLVNKYRTEQLLEIIKNAFCNSHCRRNFKKAEVHFPEEAEFFIKLYKEIYKLEAEARGQAPPKILEIRFQMKTYFKEMQEWAVRNLNSYSSKSSLGKAMKYLLRNYVGLTLFLSTPQIPIDNNQEERLLRSPVVGRKTWLGTHSKRGAKTAAILFSLVESCKLIKVNPREYFKKLVEAVHHGKPHFTPREFKKMMV